MTLRHTRPDFGVPPSVFSSPGSSQDVMEALARIGAIGNWVRGGKLIYATSWESGPGGWSTNPVVGSVAVDGSNPFHGARSLKVTPQTVSAFESLSQKRFPLIYHSRYGLEVLISMDPAATGWELFLGFLSGLYATVPQYAVKYDKGTDSLSYLNSSGTFTQFATGIADLRTSDGVPIWVLAKLLVSADPAAFGYHAFVLNDRVYDMRSLDFRNTASLSSNPRLTAQLWAFDTSGGAHPTWFDCLLLTTDEQAYVT